MPLYKWSKTAANNATADSTINWAEGMAPSAVNDSARAEMAAVAKWRDDISGTLSGTLAVTGASTFTGATTHNGGLTSTTGIFSGVLTQQATSYGMLAIGTTAQRPGSPAAGQFRYNSTLGAIEFYDGGAWWQPTSVPAGFKNLLIVHDGTTPNPKMDVTADYVCL